MATKAEGIYGCTILGGKFGAVDGVPTVQINVQITDGPDKGQRCTYEEIVNTKTAKYVNWSCSACGWRGPDLTTLEKDIDAWIAKTGGSSTVEIKHVEVKRGKAFDRWVAEGRKGPAPVWDKVGGIGRGAAKPLAPIAADALKDANDAMREFAGGGGFDDAPPPTDDDQPFATSSIAASLGEIAKVLL